MIQQSERHHKTEKRHVQSGSPLSRIHLVKRKRAINKSSKPPNKNLLVMIKKRHRLATKSRSQWAIPTALSMKLCMPN